MSYVVRALFPEAQPRWLTAPKLEGCRTFGTRDLADVFETLEDADDAIDAMIECQNCARMGFSVEAAQGTIEFEIGKPKGPTHRWSAAR